MPLDKWATPVLYYWKHTMRGEPVQLCVYGLAAVETLVALTTVGLRCVETYNLRVYCATVPTIDTR